MQENSPPEPSSPTLQPLTAALLKALTPQDVTSAVIERGVVILGARAGLVALVVADGRALELIESHGFAMATLSPWKRVPIDAHLPLSDVVRTAIPLYIEDRADWESQYPEMLQVAEAPLQASVSLPLLVRQRVVGAIHFSFGQPRTFSADDRAVLEELARQCALALDRAQLLQEAQMAERRQAFLASATTILSESLDYGTRLESLARLCVPELADWSGVDILAEDDSLVRLAVAHRDPTIEPVMREIQSRFPTDPRSSDQSNRGVVGVIRSGERLFVPEISTEMLEASSLDPEHKRLLKVVGLGAVLVLPLTVRGHTLGAITLGLMPEPDAESVHIFDTETILLAEEIARRAATAVDNARLFESQRRIAEALGISEQRYRRLLATALEGIMFLDAEANIVYVNQQMARMLAYDTPGDLIGKDVYYLFFPEDAPIARSRWQARLLGVQEQYELRLRRKDGQACWTIAHVSIEREEKNGAFQGTFTMFTDITERRRIQQELQARNEEIVTIFERVNDAFSAFDHEWRFVYVNQEAEQLLGRPRAQLLGKCIWDEFDGARETIVYEQYLYAVREQVTVAFEVYYGPFLGWFEVRAYPSPSGLSAYFRNITARKVAEIERETAAAEKAALIAELEAASLRQRRFLREMLSSLTEGRLFLCDAPDDLPPPLPFLSSPMVITKESLRAVRLRTTRVAAAIGLKPERLQDLLTAVGEASMNAVVHAGSGAARISHDGIRRIQVQISDQGKGIAEDAIHRATLERGYSSAGTLGHGFWIMLKTADHVYLLTGPEGTTVVLEQNVAPAEPGWLDSPVR